MENNNNNNTATTPTTKTPSSSSKLRSKILKILPKAAAAVSMTFQNPPFSPGREQQHLKPRSSSSSDNTSATTTRLKPYPNNKGFSGPIMIRIKAKEGGIIETQQEEPTSPKVSCIGQIKHNKKKQNAAKSMSLPTVEDDEKNNITMKKQGSKRFQRMLIFNTGKPKTGLTKSSASPSSVIDGQLGENSRNGKVSDDNAPPIGYMRRFASGRDTFANFDWKTQIAPEEMNHAGGEQQEQQEQQKEQEEEEEEEVMIPFSAPIGGRGGGNGAFGGGGVGNSGSFQPRKEINLWKRRTMAQPRPLQLNPVLTASK